MVPQLATVACCVLGYSMELCLEGQYRPSSGGTDIVSIPPDSRGGSPPTDLSPSFAIINTD
jgi:hypothetical protein